MLQYFVDVPISIIDYFLSTDWGIIIAGFFILGAGFALFRYFLMGVKGV